ncbi:MAG TPA: hypothetical protein VGN93_14060 [Shinella sp.]|jgi:hypothetical protein|uniref:hypothetical protein n=1 Tax=Shinella TaxID=323620 RepID=UPI001F595694|nr:MULTISPECIES: hypothetical protein [Shinella]CAI0341869.1 hypothetical protein SHINE37_90111 [Rhizobiaceae bacterium]CAK7262328.1 protein of unknown function [Shinella sp. WSC3-e]HEV7248103.1 hypothetical protein [Shinella sp.]
MSDWKFGSDWMAKMGNIGEKTLGPVTIYGGMVMEQCEKNRKKFKAEKLFPDISQAHASAISALVNFLSRIAGKSIPEDRVDIHGQMTLIAHFVQGIQFVETAIVEGLYPQAATLLRQEHEIVAAVEEYSAGRRKDAKTPFATIGVLKNMGQVYGDLSGAAHVSQAQLLKDIVIMEMGEKRGPSLLPIYHKDLSQNLYALHVSYITMIAQLADEVHRGLTGEEFHEDELKLLVIAKKILIDSGLMKLETPENAEKEAND